MHCIVLSAPRGRDTWKLRRSVEIIGYHRDREEVEILFLLYAENKLPVEEGENCLCMMHRGNVECRWKPSWPLPYHRDEETAGRRDGVSIAASLYEPAFELQYGELSRVRTLRPWDSWETITPHVVHRWHAASDKRKLDPQGPRRPLDEYIPFTSWEIGNFTEPGLYLMSFALRFKGETYKRLVGRQPQFTIDGPERLLTRAKYEILNREDREVWSEKLALFERGTVFSEKGYDVIILNPPLADKIDTFTPSGMAQAPLQPKSGGRLLGTRFITLSHEFTIRGQYATQTDGVRDRELVRQ